MLPGGPGQGSGAQVESGPTQATGVARPSQPTGPGGPPRGTLKEATVWCGTSQEASPQKNKKNKPDLHYLRSYQRDVLSIDDSLDKAPAKGKCFPQPLLTDPVGNLISLHGVILITHKHLFVFIYIYLHLFTFIYIYLYLFTFIYIYLFTYLLMFIYIYSCLFTLICTHLHLFVFFVIIE